VRRALQVVRPGPPLHACLGGRPVLAIQPHLGVLRLRAGFAGFAAWKPYPNTSELAGFMKVNDNAGSGSLSDILPFRRTRLVSLQEYERVRATYSPPLIPL
jgi:hypothetical protein